MNFVFISFLILALITLSHSSHDWSSDMQPGKWHKDAINKLNQMLNRKLNKNIAKNIILFLGDGKQLTEIIGQ